VRGAALRYSRQFATNCCNHSFLNTLYIYVENPAIVTEQTARRQLTDEEVVAQILAGETELFELIMRRYNQRLYRVVRAILRNEDESEDVMQEAYVKAYEHLRQFAGRSQFSTWLTRIAIHEALARIKRNRRTEQLDMETIETGEGTPIMKAKSQNPEEQTSGAELRRALESAVLAIPEQFRMVLMMRDIEQMSTAETAAALDLSIENVKVRLHRARALVRKQLYTTAGAQAHAAFGFMGERCDRIVNAVLLRLHGMANPDFTVSETLAAN
jgi:RNA polymerase sigma-70 factor, ECF subfamily